ncbi:hypothetical protein QFZ77_006094 [Paenibacillus sp. V4I3]|uniref:CBO0543 family protein n=1 Tax=unclassified Paenibacillus TaxID=185978 RepID=UPI00277E4CF3|nr:MULTISPECIES: CBO0543 family protein [unclassified Paenibacillus]MDQ0877435.1 hypothetical protein [Paenibacillus sp. V4I3]MDQ0886700.1 hypothetical protein [Paenibacillus sp. V4I9]
MHLILTLVTILAAWRWSDWRDWKQYHSSMLYVVAAGFLYEFLTLDQTLWVFHPDFFYNQTITIIVYAVVTMPLTILLYLSNYPKTIGKQILHICLWIGIYVSVEVILFVSGRITYQNGWNLGYSVLFDTMMFPMIKLHHSRPLLAYIISIPIVYGLILLFHIQLQ